MTAAELLKPRFEVIAEYPKCVFKKGMIIKEWHLEGWCIDVNNNQSDILQLHNITPYPHLFKPLNWWEHRKVEDMPKKLKANFGVYLGIIRDVEKWDLDNYLVFFDSQKRQYKCLFDWNSEQHYLPID